MNNNSCSYRGVPNVVEYHPKDEAMLLKRLSAALFPYRDFPETAQEYNRVRREYKALVGENNAD